VPRHDPEPSFTTRPTIMARRGVVAAGHYLAAQVGLEVLERGGNGIDAGVATAFALTLLKPHECGIGGECPILIYEAARGGRRDRPASPGRPNPYVISGQGAAPRLLTIGRVRELGLTDIPGTGLIAAAVPATVGALITALIESGTLGLEETLGPVVDLAREGCVVYPALRSQLAAFERRLNSWPSSAEVYLDGGVPDVGGILYFPVWARAMTKLLDASVRHRGEGRVAALQASLDAFYRGPIADAIEAFVAPARTPGRASDGEPPAALELADLAAHRSTVESPVTFRYRGLDVIKSPPWSQGPVFLQQLALLAGDDLGRLGHNSPEYIHLVTEAAKLAFADREAFYGDPAFGDVPMARLLSPEYNRERRALIDPGRASTELRPGAGSPAGIRPAYDGTKVAGDTTHVDVIDAEGNLFTATPSGGWLQSSPVVPGLGFPLGTRLQQFNLVEGHPNALAPGKRPRTTLTPTLVLRDGAPRMVFGTEGGDNQDQWTLQLFLNVVDFGMDLQAALDAPLFHSAHFPSSFHPHDMETAGLRVEGRIPPSTVAALEAVGHVVTVGGDWDFGQVTAARITPETGLLEAGASPRSMAAYAVGR
jgi:gamma-glutamyltranspeptidase/glutathione hydrolase